MEELPESYQKNTPLLTDPMERHLWKQLNKPPVEYRDTH